MRNGAIPRGWVGGTGEKLAIYSDLISRLQKIYWTKITYKILEDCKRLIWGTILIVVFLVFCIVCIFVLGIFCIFTASASRPIQSRSCDVRIKKMCFVPSVDDWNRESWRLLVEERIANIGKLRPLFWMFRWFFQFFKKNMVFASLKPP